MLITVSTLFNAATQQIEAHFCSPQCGASESSELWAGQSTGKFVVIESSHYYDEQLRQRRNTGNMLSPWQPTERLTLVGQVWGVSQNSLSTTIYIGSAVIEAVPYA